MTDDEIVDIIKKHLMIKKNSMNIHPIQKNI